MLGQNDGFGVGLSHFISEEFPEFVVVFGGMTEVCRNVEAPAVAVKGR